MKTAKRPIQPEDVELVPDAMERLEGAIKHAARQQQPDKPGTLRRVTLAKPKQLQRILQKLG